MGRKISVDSATMMNKGLEVIEARWLFDVAARAHRGGDPPAEHRPLAGRVRRRLGDRAARRNPDMRMPIAHALACPERIESGATPLDLAAHRRARRSSSPTWRASRACGLAYEALRARRHRARGAERRQRGRGRGFPRGRLPFTGIAGVIETRCERCRRAPRTIARQRHAADDRGARRARRRARVLARSAA